MRKITIESFISQEKLHSTQPIREIRNYDVLSAIKYLEPTTWRWQEVPKPVVMSDRQDTPHGKCQQHSDILLREKQIL